MKNKANWLVNPTIECFLIALPPFAVSLFVVVAAPWLANQTMSTLWWIICIVGIDVSHVYATLYRTYFDPEQRKKYRSKLFFIPLMSFVIGAILYQFGSFVFWRVLAYIAVFHFIRQQYGLMRLYSRNEKHVGLKNIQHALIYLATLYPLIYWHCYGPFQFHWFTETDFIFHLPAVVEQVVQYMYGLLILIYAYVLIHVWRKYREFNMPAFLVVTGTMLSWYIGIVYCKFDVGFTLLNVVSHGVPYMTLVWIIGKRNADQVLHKHHSNRTWHRIFSLRYLPVFLLILWVFSYIEEGVWDMTVWHEHNEIFGIFQRLFKHYHPVLNQLVVPILIVPQLTHYILDGFIWKISKGHVEA